MKKKVKSDIERITQSWFNSKSTPHNEEIADDEEVRHLAAKLIDEGKIKKIPLQKLQNYSSYMMGMRMAYLKLFPKIINLTKKKDKPYVIAEYKLLISQIDATYDYQQDIYQIRYRNHKRNKKGELFLC